MNINTYRSAGNKRMKKVSIGTAYPAREMRCGNRSPLREKHGAGDYKTRVAIGAGFCLGVFLKYFKV